MTEHKNLYSDRKHYHEHTEWVSDHLEEFFEDSSITVYHEIPTFDLHIDIYLIEPKNSSYKILITSGMSTLKMKVSKQAENPNELEFAELMILIPKQINFEQIYTGENKNDWIITILKRTAKFPHFYDTWLQIGHSIQAEEDMTPYNNDTEFVGALILPSVTFDEEFTKINKNGRCINIYSVFPLYKNELEYKVKNGFNKFLDLLIKANTKEVLDLNRKSLIPKKTLSDRLTRKQK